jgi:hypothetical protein
MPKPPRSKPPREAHELTTDQLAKRLFPKKAREAVLAEAQKARKTEKKSMDKDST